MLRERPHRFSRHGLPRSCHLKLLSAPSQQQRALFGVTQHVRRVVDLTSQRGFSVTGAALQCLGSSCNLRWLT